jgi:hypothetical protein
MRQKDKTGKAIACKWFAGSFGSVQLHHKITKHYW